MRAKWLGVALAAGLVCGYGFDAQATTEKFTFSLRASGKPFDASYNYAYYTVSIDMLGNIEESEALYSFNYDGTEEYVYYDDALGKAHFSTSVLNFFPGYSEFNFSAEDITFSYSKMSYYQDFNDNITDPYSETGTYKGSVSGSVFIGGETAVDLSVHGSLGDASDNGFSDFSYQLYTVPLPSSAPMFGAALTVFGAVGYGLKRRGKAAAAA